MIETARLCTRAGPIRTVILGAAGRDFHNFNMLYRGDDATRVVAFTATQIPGITDRRYPPTLAGPGYPKGIPIVDENKLEDLCRTEHVQRVVFAYSDVTHLTVMHLASRALAAGADFMLPGPDRTMLEARRPVIAVTAVRTGCGKSPVSRHVSRRLRDLGLRVAVLRHPMPYGDLGAQAVQRFVSLEDLEIAKCTIEEREEYEPHLAIGNTVFAGVDYAAILAAAEAEADIILWDGGNNDFPFVRPDLSIVLVDALRPDQLTTHHPGETVLRRADIVLVSKADAAPRETVERLITNVHSVNSRARILCGRLAVAAEFPDQLQGRRVLVIEDGPTLTHGGMSTGAGYAACCELGVAAIVDPRAAAVGEIAAAYRTYPHIGPVLPALGYGAGELQELKHTIDRVDADVVAVATPADLASAIDMSKPSVRIRYEYEDAEDPGLGELVDAFVRDETGKRVIASS